MNKYLAQQASPEPMFTQGQGGPPTSSQPLLRPHRPACFWEEPLYWEHLLGAQCVTCHPAPSQPGFQRVSELHGDSGHPLGRFGAAIAALADLNGDGLLDVAVGAPLEAQGAVYIFNGQQGGLSPQPSQVRSPTCQSDPTPT